MDQQKCGSPKSSFDKKNILIILFILTSFVFLIIDLYFNFCDKYKVFDKGNNDSILKYFIKNKQVFLDLYNHTFLNE